MQTLPPLGLRVHPTRRSPTSRDRVELTGGRLCLDFANTVYRRGTVVPVDCLPGYDDLLRWSEQAGALTPREVSRLRIEARQWHESATRVFRRAIRLREAIFAVFSTLAERRVPPKAHLGAIYREFMRSWRHWHLRADPTGYAWMWAPAELRLDKMLPPIAHSAIKLLFAPELRDLRECAAHDCAWLFMDTSRTRRRRWCDMRVCGNRAKVRRYYERRRAQRPSGRSAGLT